MRSRIVVAIVALAVPCSAVTAQQPAPAAPGTVVTSVFHAAGTQYGGWLMTAFDSISASKYSYKPTPAQMSMGEIMPHLENANYLLCTRFSGIPHPMTARDSTADTLKALWPKDTLVARLKASFAFCDAAFAKVTDANLADTISVTTPGGVRKVTRARLVLVFVMDLVDHYSQLSNYMRLNGMIPPSSYPRPK